MAFNCRDSIKKNKEKNGTGKKISMTKIVFQAYGALCSLHTYNIFFFVCDLFKEQKNAHSLTAK